MSKFDLIFIKKPIQKSDIVIAVVYIGEKILLCKKYNSSTWEFPGGHVEKNESEFEAIKRELQEEANISEYSTLKKITSFLLKQNSSCLTGTLFRLDLDNYTPQKMDYEIESVKLFNCMPKNISYSYQNILINEAEKYNT